MFAVIPFKPDVQLNYYPVISIIIIILCVSLHIRVADNLKDISVSSVKVCEEIKSRKIKIAIKSIYGSYSNAACANFLFQAHTYPQADLIIDKFVEQSKKISIYSKKNSKKFVKKYLTKAYKKFEKSNPPEYLTGEYIYMGGSWDVTRMVTSSFAHASWDHLIGNVFGYLSFGLFVELIIGPIFFFMLFSAICLGVGVASSLWYSGSDIPIQFLGLSGIVFGMMGALVYLWPQARIKAILWIIIYFRFISLSAWILALFYIGWNIYYLSQQTDSNVNFIAHLIGALIGFVFAFFLLKSKKEDLQYMID